MSSYNPDKKYYLAVLEERNGEQEYSHNVIIQADNDTDALVRAENIAREWYEADYTQDKDWIEFDFGVAVKVEYAMPITPVEFFERCILS